MDEGSAEFEVEEIVDDKIINGVQYYMVKWLGYSKEENTWEPADGLINCQEIINEYWDQKSHLEKKTISASSRRSSGSDSIITSKRAVSDNNSISSSKNVKRKKVSSDSRSLNEKIKAILNNNHNSEDEDKLSVDDDGGSTSNNTDKLQAPLLDMQAERNRNVKSKAKSSVGNRNLVKLKGKGNGNEADASITATAEKILGATKSKGKLWFMVKWKNSSNISVMPSEKMNKAYPQLVIQFYEARIVWLQSCESNDSDDGDIGMSNQNKFIP
ncbi:Testis-specific chromodomain protein Y 1 [Trichoplax sp. H2]|nr:Testis-specific chromodomain protein Y 1 [Trichoplax sp. H2]|eukprot:RDD37430.1 Testis-specific chromodomain protein Y 1 [Trichoplax sp. H2]